MTAPLPITAQATDLVTAYAAALAAAGLTAWPSSISGARNFCRRYPTPGQFTTAPLEQQLAVVGHPRRFACWLMVTGQLQVGAAYLAAADLRLGATAARHHPELRDRIAATATMLGSDPEWIRHQFSALAQVAALFGVLPTEVTATQVETARTDLVAAFAKPDHPKELLSNLVDEIL